MFIRTQNSEIINPALAREIVILPRGHLPREYEIVAYFDFNNREDRTRLAKYFTKERTKDAYEAMWAQLAKGQSVVMLPWKVEDENA